jgi:hypothetical protein
MRRVQIMLAGVAILLGLTAASASAKPRVLILEAATEPIQLVQPGELWEFGVGALAFERSSGTSVECNGHFVANELEGEVLATGKATDVIRIDRTFLELKERASRPCEESVEAGIQRATYVGVGGFPWSVSLRAGGTASIKGKAFVTVTTVLTEVAEPHTETSERCVYQAAKLDAAEVIEGPLSVTFNGLLKRTPTSPKSCPKTVHMTDKGPAFALDSPFGAHSGELFYEVIARVL